MKITIAPPRTTKPEPTHASYDRRSTQREELPLSESETLMEDLMYMSDGGIYQYCINDSVESWEIEEILALISNVRWLEESKSIYEQVV